MLRELQDQVYMDNIERSANLFCKFQEQKQYSQGNLYYKNKQRKFYYYYYHSRLITNSLIIQKYRT